MIVMLLNKDNWDIIGKESPNSFKKFMDYIDDFKASCSWDELFNSHYSLGGDLKASPKFHEIPFAMQKGIVENFFLLEDITYYPLKIEGKETWSFHTVDMTEGRILTKTIDQTNPNAFEYISSEEAEVAAIGVAFQILNDGYVKNLN